MPDKLKSKHKKKGKKREPRCPTISNPSDPKAADSKASNSKTQKPKASDTFKKNITYQQLRIANGSCDRIIQENTTEIKKTFEDLLKFPSFSDLSLFSFLDNPEDYNKDPDIAFFIDELNKQCETIKNHLGAIPDNLISTDDKEQFYTAFMKKLPSRESYEGNPFLDTGRQLYNATIGAWFNKKNEIQENLDNHGLLRNAQQAFSEILAQNSWDKFKQFLEKRHQLTQLKHQKNAFRKQQNQKLTRVKNNLENWLKKVDYKFSTEPEKLSNLLAAGQKEHDTITEVIDDLTTYKTLETQQEGIVNDTISARISLLDTLILQERNHINNCQFIIQRLPAKSQLKSVETFYLNQKNKLIDTPVKEIMKHAFELIAKDTDGHAILLDAAKNHHLQAVDRMKYIHAAFNNSQFQLISIFCEKILNINATLQEIDLIVKFYTPKLERLWKIKHLQKKLYEQLEKNESDSYEIINRHYEEYINNAHQQNETQCADTCIYLFKTLLSFHQYKNDITFLETKKIKKTLPENIQQILKHFPKELSKYNTDTIQLREKLSILSDYHKTERDNFRDRYKGILKEKQRNLQNNYQQHIDNENIYAATLRGSVEQLKERLVRLKNHISRLDNSEENVDLSEWTNSLNQQMVSIQKDEEQAKKRLGRCQDYKKRLESPHYRTSLEILKKINEEIVRVCSKHIHASHKKTKNKEMKTLIEENQRLKKNREDKKAKALYDLSKYSSKTKITGLIDPRLPILIRLREKITSLNNEHLTLIPNRYTYPQKLINIAQLELHPDYLMQYSTGIRNWLIQKIRRWFLEPLKQVWQCISCHRSKNQLGFFKTTMGASKTEQHIANLMVKIRDLPPPSQTQQGRRNSSTAAQTKTSGRAVRARA